MFKRYDEYIQLHKFSDEILHWSLSSKLAELVPIPLTKIQNGNQEGRNKTVTAILKFRDSGSQRSFTTIFTSIRETRGSRKEPVPVSLEVREPGN